jgi:nitroreductase
MVRNFDGRPVPRPLLDTLLGDALHGPSAGFTQGSAFVVLEGEGQTDRFWELTTTPDWRARTVRHAGLPKAPVIILPMADPEAYLDRYGEPDKAGSGLTAEEAWPVPYWLVDTAFAAMVILLRAVDLGLGALFLGIFRGEKELLAELGVPDRIRPIGAIALGYPAPDLPSPSLARGRRALDDMVHRGRW